jgi:hypothetical protein
VKSTNDAHPDHVIRIDREGPMDGPVQAAEQLPDEMVARLTPAVRAAVLLSAQMNTPALGAGCVYVIADLGITRYVPLRQVDTEFRYQLDKDELAALRQLIGAHAPTELVLAVGRQYQVVYGAVAMARFEGRR